MDAMNVNSLLLGAIAMGCTMASLFFARFYRITRDRFFLFFAAAFAIMAINRMLLGMTNVTQESEPLIYCLKLVSYGFILAGVIDKNRKRVWRQDTPRTTVPPAGMSRYVGG